MIKSDGSYTTNGEWLWYIPEPKRGVWCYLNNVIHRWFLIWVCARACTKFCFNTWLAEWSLTHHKLIPVRIWGLPVCIRGGKLEISHMGSPHLHNKFVRILRATYTPRSMGNSYTEYQPPHWLKFCKILWGISVYIWETQIGPQKDPIVSGLVYVDSSTSTATQKWWVFPHHIRFLNHMDCVESYTMHTSFISLM
jgi:hypothetical protein